MGTVLALLQGAVERLRRFAYAEKEPSRIRRPRVGLALGGGFARGIAHVGVLKVLHDNQIPIDCIAGTSVGALVAAAYAGEVPFERMQQLAAATHFTDFGRLTLSWMGLASNDRLERYLRRYSSVSRFEELKTPLTIAATDLDTGQAVYFSEGPIGPALRASCAYPGLFLPVEYQDRMLVDGFLAAPLPVDPLRRMGAEVVIAVPLESASFSRPNNMAGVISRSFAIMQRYAHQDWRGKADLVIEPDVKNFAWDDFQQAPQLVAAGEVAALAALPRIRAKLAIAAVQPAARAQP